jgi:hypothetical protein
VLLLLHEQAGRRQNDPAVNKLARAKSMSFREAMESSGMASYVGVETQTTHLPLNDFKSKNIED